MFKIKIINFLNKKVYKSAYPKDKELLDALSKGPILSSMEQLINKK